MEYSAAVKKGRAVQIDSKDARDTQGTEQHLLTDTYVNTTYTHIGTHRGNQQNHLEGQIPK